MAETYKWLSGTVVKRGSDGACVPNNSENIDWQAYQQWVSEGGVTVPVDPPPSPATILSADRAGAVDSFLNSAQIVSKIERAAALVTMDRVNVIHAWVTAFKAAVAASSTLTDLKTRVAALGNLPQFQPSDIKTAIQNKINEEP